MRPPSGRWNEVARMSAQGNRSKLGWSSFPSPLAGEGGDPRSGEGEGFVTASELRRQPPCIWKEAALCDGNVAARGPMGIGPLARRTAPVPPPATTVGELWDRRRCHARPNSRQIGSRTNKAGYRDQVDLWS